MTSARLLQSFVAVLMLGSFVTTEAAQIYRWTDKEGRVHYTDTPPPATAVSGEEKSLKGNVASAGDLSYATQEATKKYPVRLYTAEKCSPCDDGRALLDKRGIPFREILVSNEAARAELKKLNESGEIPVLVVGGDVRKGYEAGSWNSALDTAGYPKTSVLANKTSPAPATTKPHEVASPPKGRYSTP